MQNKISLPDLPSLRSQTTRNSTFTSRNLQNINTLNYYQFKINVKIVKFSIVLIHLVMPIFMDVHIVPGVKAKDVAEAHRLDLLHQQEHGCNCMTYWIDEARENIFCLIEAPDKYAVEKMHNDAHGLIPNKIIEVNSNLVETFLGRIYDPSDAQISSDGLKVFTDPSFRILL